MNQNCANENNPYDDHSGKKQLPLLSYKVFSDVMEKAIDKALGDVLSLGTVTFYTGGIGVFDEYFCNSVRRAKVKNKKIKLVLVMPYFSNRINTDKKILSELYDDVIIPQEMAFVHYKKAITLRNRWLVDRSDMIISGVVKNHGGAWEAVRYANKKNKQIISFLNNILTETKGSFL